MPYNVLRVEYRLGIQDPLMGPQTRFHNVIFIQSEADGGGLKVQVDGDIVTPTGMYFEVKKGVNPESEPTFEKSHYLGQIRAADKDATVELMRRIPPPPRQRIFDPATMAMRPCKVDGELYGTGEEIPAYKKCTEWTLLDAIPALRASGYLVSDGVPAALANLS